MTIDRRIDNFSQNGEREKSLEKLLSLLNIEDIDLEGTFALNNEKGVGDADKVYWVKLKKDNKVIEGKLFIPKTSNEMLIIFEPGMPGDSNVWMEEKFVPEFLKEKYTTFCVRHRGTKTDVDGSNNYISCEERIKSGLDNGENIIGSKEEYTVEDIAREPETALNILAPKFKSINLIGHSNGAAGHAYSLNNLPKEITNKVRNFISLAGFISKYDKEKDFFDAEGRFNGEGMVQYYEYCKKFINLGDTNKNVELQKKIFNLIYNKEIPGNINLILVSSPKDE